MGEYTDAIEIYQATGRVTGPLRYYLDKAIDYFPAAGPVTPSIPVEPAYPMRAITTTLPATLAVELRSLAEELNTTPAELLRQGARLILEIERINQIGEEE